MYKIDDRTKFINRLYYVHNGLVLKVDCSVYERPLIDSEIEISGTKYTINNLYNWKFSSLNRNFDFIAELSEKKVLTG